MTSAEEQGSPTTGIVAWYDYERGVGSIRPDDGTEPCAVRSVTLRAAEIDSLTPGDRVRFRMREEGGERIAVSVAPLRSEQAWEDNGGAVRDGDPDAV